MIVTKIERQKRNPSRFNLYLDGEFAFGVHRDVLAAYGIRTGDDLSDTITSRMKTSEELNLAEEAAIRLLSHRRRSEHEILIKLREKEFPPPAIEQVIANLRTRGLLDDLAFAKTYIHDRELKKPTGQRLLERELRLRGVPGELIEHALREALPESGQEAIAKKAAMQALRRHSLKRIPGDTAKQRQKIAQTLTRRGFPWEIVSKILKGLFGESQGEEE